MGRIMEIFWGSKLTVPETFEQTTESQAIVRDVEERTARHLGYTATNKQKSLSLWPPKRKRQMQQLTEDIVKSIEDRNETLQEIIDQAEDSVVRAQIAVDRLDNLTKEMEE